MVDLIPLMLKSMLEIKVCAFTSVLVFAITYSFIVVCHLGLLLATMGFLSSDEGDGANIIRLPPSGYSLSFVDCHLAVVSGSYY